MVSACLLALWSCSTTEVQQLMIVGSRRARAAAGQGSVGQGPAPLLLRAGLAGRSSHRPHLERSQHLDEAGVAVQHRLQLVVVFSDSQLSSSTAALCEAGVADKHWQQVLCFQSADAGLCASVGAVSSAQVSRVLVWRTCAQTILLDIMAVRTSSPASSSSYLHLECERLWASSCRIILGPVPAQPCNILASR